ncbi:MAG TPA: hypothetical protein VHM31_19745 [Polyangia bacterium]|nr:hypothetical protein [Polyangia bacterium]
MSAALNKSPLARVKDEFGGKDKLVDKLVGILDAGDRSKDDLRKTLLGVANRKLVRLHAVATRTKDVGGHDKLVSTTAERLNRAKDKDYVTKLDGLSDAKLLDMLTIAERKAKAKEAAGAKAPAKKEAKPQAKASRPAKGGDKPAKAAGKTSAKTASKRG